jgi:MFS family permease
MSDRTARNPMISAINERVFYGWVILAIAGIGIFASGPGQSHGFSVFIGPIGDDLGISATAIASAYGLATLVAALGLPVMGRLVDRHGTRRMLSVSAILLGAACIAFGLVPSAVMLAFGFAALRFFGQGSLMLNCGNLVSQWFEKRRGLALSLMMLGFSLSMAVHPALGEWLIGQVGWRQAYLWLGLMTWVLLVPLVAVFVRHRPEDVGLAPDGEDSAGATGATIGAGLFTITMLVTAFHFFQVSIMVEHGLDRSLGARIFTISAVTMVVAMPLYGRLLDMVESRYMFALGLAIQGAALVSMAATHDLGGAVFYGVVFGFNNAASLSLFGFMWPRYFGRKHLGSIQGTGQMIMVVGASMGPLPLGAAYDLFGDFDAALRILAVLPLACAVLALFLRTPAAMATARGAVAQP